MTTLVPPTTPDSVIELAPDAEALSPWTGPPERVPRATYRLQIRPEFPFDAAAEMMPYLKALGVSDLYSSPVFKALPGSDHGYDVTDYGQLNPELGGDDAFARLTAARAEHDLGLVLDFVPNHMGIGPGGNEWWLEVLEHGRAAPHGGVFDIDWTPLAPDMRGRVLIPVLGDQYGVVLERGELQLRFDHDGGAFWIDYWDNTFPVAPQTYPMILGYRLEELVATLPEDDHDLLELRSIITACGRLPGPDQDDSDAIAERQRETLVNKRRLADLAARHPPVADHIATTVAAFNGNPDDPTSFNPLDELLEAQTYRLAFWRIAAEEINYRRFFAINELAAIRQEERDVFDATHALLLSLLTDGTATGVRIDHVDGLLDPGGYLRQLRVAAGRPFYLLVEKILEHGELLPDDWPVHGTTGYDFANAATGLFVDSANRRAFDDIYARFVGEPRQAVNFGDIVYTCKRLILRVALASELNVLVNSLDRIASMNRRSRDFTPATLREGLREVIASFPVYRSYITWDAETETAQVSNTDREVVNQAVATARRRNPAVDPTVFTFIRDVLVLEVPNTSLEHLARCAQFATKVQQLSGPVMAKGLEDTAFYRYFRLAALNEVGGDPGQFGTTVSAFHEDNVARLERLPDAMLSSSTHDTKRSEDVRARMAVLSEFPRTWRSTLNRWARLNRRWKTEVDGQLAPDRNDEYLVYQTILGAWPFDHEVQDASAWDAFVRRIIDAMVKSAREAQVHTSWVNPTAYEDAITAFVHKVLDRDRPRGNAFLRDAESLRRLVTHVGLWNGLGQQLLKLTVPGVPDIYQGTECWDFSLVDPDNRRPVDFDARRAALADLASRLDAGPDTQADLAGELVTQAEDGRIKLYVTHRALILRARHEEIFRRGAYLPLEAEGLRAEHVIAFARRAGEREVVVIVPRLIHGLTRGEAVPPIGDTVWGTTSVILPDVAPGTTYQNIFTGERITATDTGQPDRAALFLTRGLGAFPVALLERIEE